MLFKSNSLHAATTKALRAVKMIKDQIQYRSQSLLNLARGYFSWSNNQDPEALSYNNVQNSGQTVENCAQS